MTFIDAATGPSPTMTAAPRVSVVTIFLNAARFLEEAIASVLAQTYDDWELILVDDGSTDGSTPMALAAVARSPDRVRYAEHDGHTNRGMSVSRRLGVELARGTLVAFLDSDDTWCPSKLQEQVSLLDAQPRAKAVFGAPLYWHGWTGEAADRERDHVPGLPFDGDRLFESPELLFLTAPLGSGPVPCPSDIMIRRDTIMQVGGSEPRFRGVYEDVALFVKIFLREPAIASTRCWTNYRIHPESCLAEARREGTYTSSRLLFLNWFEEYLSRNGLGGTEAWTRLQEKLAPYRDALSSLAMSADTSSRLLTATPNPLPADSRTTTISWTTGGLSVGQVWVSQDGGHETLFGVGATGSQEAGWINAGMLYEFRLYGDAERSNLLDTLRVSSLVSAEVGGESFGSLRRVVPVSRAFGFDRGQPIDRYYIDAFLTRHADDIRGRVLEIGEATYTRRFGGTQVSAIDVLHVTAGHPDATIIADLADGVDLPSSVFDCILLIQTLHLIFDVTSVIRTLHRILKPGGVLLATFPGISHKSLDEWRDSWYWGFTSLSARRLFGHLFPQDALTIDTCGNVLVASAFLYGLAASELTAAELNYRDESYEALVTVRAVKPVDGRNS